MAAHVDKSHPVKASVAQLAELASLKRCKHGFESRQMHQLLR